MGPPCGGGVLDESFMCLFRQRRINVRNNNVNNSTNRVFFFIYAEKQPCFYSIELKLYQVTPLVLMIAKRRNCNGTLAPNNISKLMEPNNSTNYSMKLTTLFKEKLRRSHFRKVVFKREINLTKIFEITKLNHR